MHSKKPRQLLSEFLATIVSDLPIEKPDGRKRTNILKGMTSRCSIIKWESTGELPRNLVQTIDQRPAVVLVFQQAISYFGVELGPSKSSGVTYQRDARCLFHTGTLSWNPRNVKGRGVV